MSVARRVRWDRSRQGEEKARCAFSPGTHLASHLRHLQTPKCRVGPRARCVASLRVLTSVVLRKSRGKRFFFLSSALREKDLCFRPGFYAVFAYTTRDFSFSSSESSWSRFWRGLVSRNVGETCEFSELARKKWGNAR